MLYVAITGWSHYTIQVNGRSSNSSYNNTASTYQFSQLCRCRTNRRTDKQIDAEDGYKCMVEIMVDNFTLVDFEAACCILPRELDLIS